jgi:hypothetical protein
MEWRAALLMDWSDEPTDSVGNTDEPFDDGAAVHTSYSEESFLIRSSPTTRIIIWSQTSGEVVRLEGSDVDFPTTNHPIGLIRSWERIQCRPRRPTDRCESYNIEGTDVSVQRKQTERQPGRVTTHLRRETIGGFPDF